MATCENAARGTAKLSNIAMVITKRRTDFTKCISRPFARHGFDFAVDAGALN
jgi:hypothetical protein